MIDWPLRKILPYEYGFTSIFYLGHPPDVKKTESAIKREEILYSFDVSKFGWYFIH